MERTEDQFDIKISFAASSFLAFFSWMDRFYCSLGGYFFWCACSCFPCENVFDPKPPLFFFIVTYHFF